MVNKTLEQSTTPELVGVGSKELLEAARRTYKDAQFALRLWKGRQAQAQLEVENAERDCEKAGLKLLLLEQASNEKLTDASGKEQ